MAIKTINSKIDFEKEIKEGKYLVDFYADWCGPCQMLAPILGEVSEELEKEEVTIIKVNVDQAPDIAALFNVMSIPTMFLIKDGETISSEQGFKPANQIIDWTKTI